MMFTTIKQLAEDVQHNQECLGWVVTMDGDLYDTGDIFSEGCYFPWKSYDDVAMVKDCAAFVQHGMAIDLDRGADFLVLPASERGQRIRDLAVKLAEVAEIATNSQEQYLESLDAFFHGQRVMRGERTESYLKISAEEAEEVLEKAIGEEQRIRREFANEMVALLVEGPGELLPRENLALPGDPDDDDQEDEED